MNSSRQRRKSVVESTESRLKNLNSQYYSFKNVENIPLEHEVGLPVIPGTNNLSLNIQCCLSRPSGLFQSFIANSTGLGSGRRKSNSPYEIFLKFGTTKENIVQFYYAYGSVYDELEVLHKQTLRFPEDEIILKVEWFLLKILNEGDLDDGPVQLTDLTLILVLSSTFLYFYSDDGIKCITKFSFSQDLDMEPGMLLKCFALVGKYFYGSAESGEIYVFTYDTKEQRVVFSLKYDSLETGSIVDMISNGETIVCAYAHGVLTYWKAGSLNTRSSTRCISASQGVYEKAYFWDKKTIVVTTNIGYVHIYSIANHVLLQSIQIQPVISIISSDFLPSHNKALLLTLSPKGIQVWTLTSKDKTLVQCILFWKSFQRNQITFYGALHLLDEVKGNPVGARFLNTTGKLIGVTSVGEKCLNIYARRKP